ncbi:MAG: PD-(D/E)XK nuclease family protein [Candidatus Jordarchaeaceae archaeon]
MSRQELEYKDIKLPTYPFGANIEPDPALYERLRANLDNRFSEPRPDIHVSDLVYCLRKSAFQKLDPTPVDDTSLSFFTAGKGHHDILEDLHGAEKEKEIWFENIVGHVDLLDGEPIEIKTTRSFRREIKQHWIKQLAYYCAMLNKTEGKLIILYLFPKRQKKQEDNKETNLNLIETYKVRFDDLSVILQDLLERRNLLLKALDAKDPQLAPPVSEEEKWLCRVCPYKEECKK